MARYYRRRRSPALWSLAFLVAVIALVFIARVIYAWLIALIPILGSVLLVIALTSVGFRRRR